MIACMLGMMHLCVTVSNEGVSSVVHQSFLGKITIFIIIIVNNCILLNTTSTWIILIFSLYLSFVYMFVLFCYL